MAVFGELMRLDHMVLSGLCVIGAGLFSMHSDAMTNANTVEALTPKWI